MSFDSAEYNPNQKQIFIYMLKLTTTPGVNYMVGPGQPLYLDYSEIDWKSFARELFSDLEPMPASMKVYLGNEMTNMSDAAFVQVHPGGSEMFGAGVIDLIKSITNKDCRVPIIDLAKNKDKLHPIKNSLEHSPPATGIFVGVKATPGQMSDYEYNVTSLFGSKSLGAIRGMTLAKAEYEGTNPSEELDRIGYGKAKLPKKVLETLKKHLKIEYSEEAEFILIGGTPV